MKVFERISDIVRRRPWAVVISCLVITLGLGFGLLFLKGHVTYQSLLPQDFPSVKALNALNKKFGGISYEYVVLRAPDVTDNAVVESLISMDDELASDPRFNQGQVQTHLNAQGGKIPVIQDYLTPFIAIMQREISSRGINIKLSTVKNSMVKSFTGKDYQALVTQDYLGNKQAAEQVVGRFITPDRKSALIMLKTGATLTEQQQVKLGADLDNFFTKKFAGISGAKVSIAGDATLARDFNTHIKNKTILLFAIAMILVLLTLFIAFRRISDTFLPIAVMLLAMVWTFGLCGWLGIEYSVATIAVMPLLLGHALTFVVPFIARYYEELELQSKLLQSIGKAMIAVGVALFLAAITNLVGFLVFGFSILPALRDFGITCAIGTVFIFMLTAALLPAVMVLRDRSYEQATGEESEQGRKYFDGLSLRKSHGVFTRATDRMLGAFTRLSTGYSITLIIIFSVLIIAGFTQIRGLTTDSDLRKLVPASLPGMSANYEVEKYFGGHQQDVIMVNGDVMSPKALQAMANVEKALVSGGDLYTKAGVTGLPDALAAANGGQLPATAEQAQQALKTAQDSGGYVTGGLLSADRKAALITLNASGAQSTAVVNRKIALMKSSAGKYLKDAGLTFTLGGITPLTKDMTKNIIPTETLSSTLSLLLCAIVLIIIFRSFPYGMITLMVALSGVAAEIGFMRIMNWPLDIMTSLVTALVIGIGVNFGILFTHRFIQEKRAGDRKAGDAISVTMGNLGRANVIAALTTVAAFVIIMFSGIVPLKRFGGVTAVAIAVCLVASLTLMPALLYMYSRRAEEREPAVGEKEAEPQTV